MPEIPLAAVLCVDLARGYRSPSEIARIITDPPYSSGGMVRGDQYSREDAA